MLFCPLKHLQKYLAEMDLHLQKWPLLCDNSWNIQKCGFCCKIKLFKNNLSCKKNKYLSFQLQETKEWLLQMTETKWQQLQENVNYKVLIPISYNYFIKTMVSNLYVFSKTMPEWFCTLRIDKVLSKHTAIFPWSFQTETCSIMSSFSNDSWTENSPFKLSSDKHLLSSAINI